MSAITATLKTVAIEKTRREIETELKLQLQIPLLKLLDTDRTFIHRKHLATEMAKFLVRMKKIYQNIYLKELEEMYDKSPYSIISRKLYIPNLHNTKYAEGIPFKYILVWYEQNCKERSIGFRGFSNYQEAEEFLCSLIGEHQIYIEDIYFIEDVDIVLDIDAIIENQSDEAKTEKGVFWE